MTTYNTDNITASKTLLTTPRTTSRISYECHDLLFFSELMEVLDLDDLGDDEEDSHSEDSSTRELCGSEMSGDDNISPFEASRGTASKRPRIATDCNADVSRNEREVGTEESNNVTDEPSSKRKTTISVVSAFQQRMVESAVQKGKLMGCSTNDDSYHRMFRFIRCPDRVSQLTQCTNTSSQA